MSYPTWRKVIDGWWAMLRPVKSERDFIRLMGWWWFKWYGFKYQYHVPPFRPDFVSPKHKLILEVEGRGKYKSGDILRDQEYAEYQQRRHALLLSKGWLIKYVWYEDFDPDSPRSNPLRCRAEVRAWVRNMVWRRRIPFLWRKH